MSQFCDMTFALFQAWTSTLKKVSDHALQVAAPHTSSAYAEVTNAMLAAAAAQRRQAYRSNQDQLKQSKKRKMSEN